MEEQFYVLWCDEDGVDGGLYNKSTLEKYLNENYWGERVVFLSELPRISDGYFRTSTVDSVEMVILRAGSVVVPKKKDVKVAWVLGEG